MRIPTYISPSQLSTWEKSPEDYYLQHLSEIRATKFLQTVPMAIGSSFDAFVKSAMHEILFGKGNDPQFEFDAIFTEQVEEQNRDWAREHGKYVFDCYKISGAYDELLQMLQDSACAPQFETKITNTIEGIPLLGKPDLRFVHKLGIHVILDWKVNGYCAKRPTSPCKYYRLCRDGWTPETAKSTIGAGTPHPKYKPIKFHGLEINAGFMEEASEDWADQLAIYGWIMGEPVGDEKVVFCIDQICSKPVEGRDYPLLRVANHRARISLMYQQILIGRLHDLWNKITNQHIFGDMSKEESIERCKVLDQQALMSHVMDVDILEMGKGSRF